jgi:lipid II isoglutaminyl synthase (glutamine-hydrolysing)
MRLLIAIFVGKVISFISRHFRFGGGSAAPGLFALRIEPNLVSKLTRNIPKNVIITGTNGKTTTTRMLGHLAKHSGLKVIRNHTGSNLERGIASTLLSSAKLFHLEGGLRWHPSFNLGIWELDEAAFNNVAPKIKPDIVVFLNIFRDQLDRYGEIDNVIKGWCQTLAELDPKKIILVNGDDANTIKLAKCFKGKVLNFGVKDYKIVGESIEHDKERENFDFEALEVKLDELKGSVFSITLNHELQTINLPLPGIYHIYDALAAIACTAILRLPSKNLSNQLINFKPAFGRFEKIGFGSIFLIKNPAGTNQVFDTVAPNLKENDRLLFCLNDKIADGTDISWVWDALFEKLRSRISKQLLICSGTRAYDLANRLKYAGFDPKSIQIEEDINNALKEARSGINGHLFIFPTYTAMLELQTILVKSGHKKHYWEEES